MKMQPSSTISCSFAVLLLALSACGGDPFGPFAGGALSAPLADRPFDDWAGLDSVDTVFIETRLNDPYSVQTWCIGVDDALYVPTSLIMGDSAAERQWVRNILADARVRVQIEGTLYAMQAVRLEDEALQARVLAAFQEKYAGELPELDEHARRAWIFQLVPR